jgi:hypothetical protein
MSGDIQRRFETSFSMKMKLEIVKYISASKTEFIEFWSKLYSYELEHLYDKNIEKNPLDEEAVWALFKWKNGAEEIAKMKKQSITNTYLPQLDKIPSLKSLEDGENYLATLGGGPIWNIFWLHCVNPVLFPIFDQHTYRSMAKILDMKVKEIPSKRPEIIRSYFDEYIPFTENFAGVSKRDLDKALFAYGRLLKRGLGGK